MSASRSVGYCKHWPVSRWQITNSLVSQKCTASTSPGNDFAQLGPHLVGMGLVEPSGIYRLTENNRRAIVWQFNDAKDSQ